MASASSSLRTERCIGSGEPGVWSVHGQTLRVSAPACDCEGAIGLCEIYVICADGEGPATQMQLVVTVARRPWGEAAWRLAALTARFSSAAGAALSDG